MLIDQKTFEMALQDWETGHDGAVLSFVLDIHADEDTLEIETDLRSYKLPDEPRRDYSRHHADRMDKFVAAEVDKWFETNRTWLLETNQAYAELQTEHDRINAPLPTRSASMHAL